MEHMVRIVINALVVEEYHNVLDMGNVLMVSMVMGHAIAMLISNTRD